MRKGLIWAGGTFLVVLLVLFTLGISKNVLAANGTDDPIPAEYIGYADDNASLLGLELSTEPITTPKRAEPSFYERYVEFIKKNKLVFFYGGGAFGVFILLWIILLIVREKKANRKKENVPESSIFGDGREHARVNALLFKGRGLLLSGDVVRAKRVYGEMRSMYNEHKSRELFLRLSMFYDEIVKVER